MNSQLIRKAYYFTSADFEAIVTIKERYGLSSDSDALRLAVRLTASSPLAQLPKRQAKQTKRGN